MKNVLVLYYTQSGQLGEIARNIASPLVDDPEIKLTFWEVKMKKEFAFPWNGTTFYNAFPESFLQIPAEIEAPSDEVLNTRYDLIILGYQVWYLSPSIPSNSLLKSEYARKIFKDTPVVTVSGTRNMWVMAQEKIKVLLKEKGAKLVGNIALTDRNINHVSVITIVHWMMSGKKTKYLGIFPKPGVSQKEIDESPQFGEIILKHFKQNSLDSLQPDLVSAGAVRIHSFLVQMDRTANKMFKVWSNLIIKRPEKRQGWLTGFKIYLLTAIWIMSPIVYILYLFTYPLKYFKFKREQSFYEGV